MQAALSLQDSASCKKCSGEGELSNDCSTPMAPENAWGPHRSSPVPSPARTTRWLEEGNAVSPLISFSRYFYKSRSLLWDTTFQKALCLYIPVLLPPGTLSLMTQALRNHWKAGAGHQNNSVSSEECQPFSLVGGAQSSALEGCII